MNFLAFAQVPTTDILGRIISEVYPDGTTILYQYDDGGNRTQRVISPCTPPLIAFGPNVAGLNVSFVNTTPNGVSYVWDFGDGGNSTLASPSHTYPAAGTYTVTVTAVNACSTSVATQVVTVNNVNCNIPGLILYYPFDYSANDSSGNNNHATSFGSPQYLPGHLGNAIHFSSATSDHLLIPTVINNSTTAFTISMWVNEESLLSIDGEGYISFGDHSPSGWAGMLHGLNPTNTMSFGIGNGSINVPAPANYQNNFIYYAMTYDNGVVNAYINGQNVGTMTQTLNIANGNAGMAIHWWANGGTSSTRFNGYMDEVKVFDNALTPQQILAIYNATQPLANFTQVTNGGNVAFTNTSTNATSYSWDFGNGQTSTLQNPSINYGTAGTYNVCLTASDGCATNQHCTSLTVTCTPPTVSMTANTPVACYGGTNGSATVAATGGTSPYTYTWNTNPPKYTAAATNLSAGTYTVTVTEAGGCSSNITVTIAQPATALSATISTQTNVSCNAGTNGSATVTATGGTSPYTYTWNTTPPKYTATAATLTAGTYIVTVKDAHNCTTTATVIITQPTVLAATTTKTNVLCNGGATGSATAVPTGGTSPFAYTWNTSPIQYTITANNLAAGTYTVTVKDAHNCTTTASATITQPTALTATISAQTHVSCNGGTNGSATVTASGGTGTKTYTWNTTPPKYTATAATLAAGTYIVTVKDANNCTTTATVIITQPTVLAATATKTNVLCNGGATGTAAATASGGTSPYTYTWNTSPAQYTANISSLVAGVYTVTTKDAKNCSATATVTITQPAIISLAFSQSNAACSGNTNGSASVTATGGTSPYTYTWNTSPNQYTASINGLGAGGYAVTVKDANACTQNGSVSLTTPSALTGTTTTTAVSCFGGSNGTASVTVAGGVSPYVYSWNTSPSQNTATATGLVTGNYTCFITDANACTLAKNVSITQPGSVLSAIISGANNVTCNGGTNGTATVQASGGTAPYTYTWNTIPPKYTATATTLSAGNYTVSVIDNKGCTATANVIITEPSALLLSLTSTMISCYGGNNGTITAVATGGVAPFEYKLNAGAYTPTNVFAGLIVGTYNITVRDANNCTYTQSIAVSQPSQIALVTPVSKTNVSCYGENDGAIMPIVTGGSGSYTYTWNTSPVQSTQNATNLTAGSYQLTVTDGNGCAFTSATIAITQPNLLANNVVTVINPTCYGGLNGSVTTSTTGGTSPFTYTWNTSPPKFTANATGIGAGTYTLTVIDNHGCTDTTMATLSQPAALLLTTTQSNVLCNGTNTGSTTVIATGGTGAKTYTWNTSPIQYTATVSSLVAGIYTVTVKDANNCTATTSVTITQPAILASIVSVTQPLCFGNTGSAIVNTTGGTAPYNYAWSSGQTTASVANLAVGSYSVITTDANACTNTQNITISQPSAISLSLSTMNPLCYGQQGQMVATATGGTGTLNFSWSSGQTTPNINASAGTYTLTVTDNNACTETATATLVQPNPISVSILTVPISCPGGNNGSANLLVLGGVSPYTYSWAYNGATTSLVTGLVAGNYAVFITDANGCVQDTLVSITQPSAPTILLNVTDAACYGTASGTASAVVTGGITPYTYSWSNGSTNATVTGMVAGSYSLTVTDGNGCHFTNTLGIGQPVAIQVSSTTIDVACNGGANGAAFVGATNGNSPYTFLWSNGAANASVGNLSAGLYTVVITDANGCNTTDSVEISEPLAVSINYTTIEPTCSNNTNGSISITTALGGNGSPYTYTWANGQTGATLTGVSAGNYTVSVVDSLGCQSNPIATLSSPPAPQISYIINPIKCYGDNNGSISALVLSSTGETFTYSWSNGQEGQSIQNLAPGSYISYITSNLGCVYVDTINIIEPTPLVVIPYNPQPGTAFASASGGTPPYTYTWNTTPVQYTDTLTAMLSGMYEVSVSDSNGCKKDTTIRINYSVGAVEIAEGTSIRLYPNPTDGQVNIEIYFTTQNCISLQLTNNLGQTLITTDSICGLRAIRGSRA